jgi:hypothetical protein
VLKKGKTMQQLGITLAVALERTKTQRRRYTLMSHRCSDVASKKKNNTTVEKPSPLCWKRYTTVRKTLAVVLEKVERYTTARVFPCRCVEVMLTRKGRGTSCLVDCVHEV